MRWRWFAIGVACFALSFPMMAQETTPEPTPPAVEEAITLPTDAPAPVEETIAEPTPTEELPAIIVEETAVVEPTDASIEEITEEVTPAPDVATVEVVTVETSLALDTLTETFEAFDATAWVLTGWDVVLDGEEAFLATTQPNATAVLTAFSHAEATLTARLRVEEGNVALLTFNGYTLMFDAYGNSRLYEGDVLLVASVVSDETPETADWFSIALEMRATTLTLRVNDEASLAYAFPVPPVAGNLTLSAGETLDGTLAIDDLTLTKHEATEEAPIVVVVETVETAIEVVEVETDAEATAEAVEETLDAEATAEATEEALASAVYDAGESKLSGELAEIAQAQRDGNYGVIGTLLLYYGFTTDESGRVLIDIGANGYASADALVALVPTLGGEVISVNADLLTVYLPVEALDAIGTNENVFSLRKATSATSTSPNASVNEAPAGTAFSDGYNVIGAHDWHLAGVTGTGVLVGVIDTGFGAVAPTVGGELSCLNNNTLNGTGTFATGDTTHGLNVVQILCDVAPSAKVNMYKANNATTLTTAINNARTAGVKVLVISLDLGADSAPGDGTNGGIAGSNPYTALETAYEAGMVIFAAAGNSGNPAHIGVAGKAPRYYAFNSGSSTTATTLSATVSRGDILRFSWNDWGANTSNFSVSFTGASGGGAVSRVSSTLPSNTLTVGSDCGDSCTITISVTPTVGSNRIFQLQIVPVLVTGETSPQTANVKINSVTLASGASVVTGAGSIARPADSQHVIAVGAVCASDESNFVALPDTSVGPIYASGGGANSLSAPFTRAQVKPDIVGPSNVRVSATASILLSACDGTIDGADTTAGGGAFGGTSAAVAHAAGMAALMKSNNAHASMAGFNNANGTGPANVRNYMQSRVVDLPLDNPDGFDMTFGAGFSMLGFPQFDLANSTTINLPPNNLACAGGFSYVSQVSLDGANNGTLSNPYTHIGYALNQAPANSCVVVMPGEYMTPILIGSHVANNVTLISYDAADSADVKNSLFRTIGVYKDDDFLESTGYSDSLYERTFNNYGAFYINNGSSDFTLSGFNFVPARFLDLAGFGGARTDVIAVFARDTDKVTISKNTFGQATVDGASYNGWVNMRSHAVTVFGGVAELADNEFVGAEGVDSTDYGALAIVDATAVVRQNRFLNNTNRVSPIVDSYLWKSIVYAESSNVDLVGNAFVNNLSQTLLMFRSPTYASTHNVRIVSNVFLDNDAGAVLASGPCGSSPNPPCPTSGGLIKIFKVTNLYFINNTVVSNDRSAAGSRNFLIVRGGEIATSIPDANRRIEFHNNIVWNNGFTGLITYDDITPESNYCLSVTTGAPVKNNRWDDGLASGKPCSANVVGTGTPPSEGGITDPSNSFAPIAFAEFAGSETGFPFPSTDWRFYALRQKQLFDAGDGTSGSIKPAEYSVFVDKGRSFQLLGLPFGSLNLNSPFDFDVAGNQRVLNIQVPDPTDANSDNFADDPNNIIAYEGEGVNAIDQGAFEYTPLRIDVDGNEANGLQVLYSGSMAEDAGVFVVDTNGFVLGGFGQLTYQLSSAPVFYGTHCAPEFAGTNGVVFGAGLNAGKIFYCPPRDFFNSLDGVTAVYSELEINFSYTVRDETFSTANGAVAVFITPVADAALTNVIGDNVPAGDVYELTMNGGTTTTVALRPFVDFTNGFFFSEENNPEFTSSPRQIDYILSGSVKGFSYAVTGVTDCNFSSSTLVTTGSLTGNILTISSADARGKACIEYNVTDGFGNTTTGNIIRVNVTSFIPAEPGIYDDTSFFFRYVSATPAAFLPQTWLGVYSANNINNTLHNTSAFDDRAEFTYRGTGFVLYMQAQGAGNDYMLTINGAEPTTNWTLVNGTAFVNAMYSATFPATGGGDTMECFTRARPGSTFTPKSLTNSGFAPYAITCYSTLNNPTEKLYTVAVTNKRAYGVLSIDAFSIINDTISGARRVLPPGTHEVDNNELRATFSAPWQLYYFALLSNGMGYRTQTNGASFEFFFEGGRGFALETYIHRLGGNYTVCIEEDMLGGNSICHKQTNAPLGASTIPAYKVFVPFMGFDPVKRYKVTVTVTSIPTLSTLIGDVIIDSIVVFPPSLKAEQTLPFGLTEDDKFPFFAYGNPVEDTWQTSFMQTTASNNTLTTIAPVRPAMGGIISFDIPDNANGFAFDYSHIFLSSRRVMICVDRARMATDFGNCITVNQRPIAALNEPTYYVVDSTNGNTTAQFGTVQFMPGSMIIRESMFSSAWGSGHDHTVEVFSLLNEGWNFDRIIVFNDEQPLGAGFHDDTLPVFKLYQADNTPGTVALHNFTNNSYVNTTATFLRRFNMPFDKGRTTLWTKQVGASIVFGFTGSGFSPSMKLDRESDEVEICWQVWDSVNDPLPGSANAQWASATCTLIDNESIIPMNAERPTLGMPYGTYAVRIKMRPDNNVPGPHTLSPVFFPLNMYFDGVTIYDRNYSTLTPIASDTTFEFNYLRDINGSTVAYTGPAMTYAVQTWNRNISGSDINTLFNFAGASATVRTLDAQALVYTYQDGFFAPVRICAVSTVNNQQVCSDVTPGTVPALKRAVIDFTALPAGEKIVTISNLNNRPFSLDAIRFLSSYVSTAPDADELGDGYHETSFGTGATHLQSPKITSTGATVIFSGLYSGVSTLNLNANATFKIHEATGFTMVTQIDNQGGAFSIRVVDTATNGGDFDQTYNFNTFATIPSYQGGFTVGGLTPRDYTVTIQKGVSRLYFDAVRVYGKMTEGYHETSERVGLSVHQPSGKYSTTGANIILSGLYTGLSTLNLSANMTFSIHQATGLTMVTQIDNQGGAFSIRVRDLATMGTTFDKTYNLNNFATLPIYQGGFTVGGLPLNDYHVEIIKGAGRLYVDAVHVYGALGTIGKYYDDQAIDDNGRDLFQYGPQGAWTRTSPLIMNIGGTQSSALRHGSTITFQAGSAGAPASGFRIFYPVSTLANVVQVCWTQLDANIGNRRCTTVDLFDRQLRKDIFFTSGTGDTVSASGIFGVTITNQASFRQLIVDAIMPLSGAPEPLKEGRYDGADPRITYAGTWLMESNATYGPNGRGMVSQTSGATATFEVEGTGFEFGTVLDTLFGGEVELCYAQGAGATSFPNCFVYQNEMLGRQADVARTIVGLPYDVYTVRIRDVEDGKRAVILNNPNAPRIPGFLVGRIVVRYVRVYNEPTATGVRSGFYDQTATDSNGVPYLQYYPKEAWGTFNDFFAYNRTVNTVVRNNAPWVLTGGQTVVLSVDKVAGENLTVALYTRPNAAFNAQMLICAGNERNGAVTWNGTQYRLSTFGTPASCTLKTGYNLTTTLTVDHTELAALGGTNSGNIRVSFTPLLQTRFDVDAFQVYRDSTLSKGVHDIFLPDNLLNFNTSGGTGAINRATFGCLPANGWCVLKNALASGGEVAVTTQQNATLSFNFEGTGFSVMAIPEAIGRPFRICYKRTSNTQTFPAYDVNATNILADRSNINMSQGQTGANAMWCDYYTTNTITVGTTGWNSRNFTRINPFSGTQYGFAYYGLPFGNYTVEVRVGPAPTVASRFQLDAIAVFGRTDNLPVLGVGFYDDTTKAISYEPESVWTTNTLPPTLRPPSAPFGSSERTTNRAGAVAQMRVDGNSVILYQSTGGISTRDAHLCLLVTNATIHCDPQATRGVSAGSNAAWERALQIAQFSQALTFGRFSPIMFYGLGEGTHTLIIENRDHNRTMSIDAIQVQR
jgi:hypothetical protein